MSTTASLTNSARAASTTASLQSLPSFKPFLLALLLVFAAYSPLSAQRVHPASWTLTAPKAAPPGASVLIELDLKLDGEWHMYSPTTPKPGPTGGPIPTTIELDAGTAIESATLLYPAPKRQFDPNFNLDTETYEKSVKFYFLARLAASAPAGSLPLTARMRYQLCTDRECLPPKRVTAEGALTVDASAAAPPATIPAGYSELKPPSEDAAAAPAESPASSRGSGSAQPLGSFLAVAFGVGLAAIFTPCVFPMIPITISFFMGQGSASRAESVTKAIIFCLGIIILFTGLGFGVTAALGPFGVVQLGSNPWVNTFICLIFFIFGLSLLGAFEITLPSGLLTKLNAASEGGGYLGVLLMGLTFSLTAFACVGPFVGTLLAASVTGGGLQPVLGMAAFSSGLALPFFFLALFPSFMNKLPRSGGWMARVKIVMGFIVIAAMLKYLSNIDVVMQWNLLTRERFLALWVVLSALPGLYLLGFLRMEGIKADAPVGVGRLLTATAFLGFAIWLIPGMFGARLGDVEAFIPPPSENSISASGVRENGAKWLKNDYAGALSEAKTESKRVLVAYTGYACTNCHWMKANMFTRPEVVEAMGSLVPVELYTDGTDAASEANQRLQESNYQTVAIPFYAIVDGDGKTLATFAGLTKNTDEFVAFLKAGA